MRGYSSTIIISFLAGKAECQDGCLVLTASRNVVRPHSFRSSSDVAFFCLSVQILAFGHRDIASLESNTISNSSHAYSKTGSEDVIMENACLALGWV